MSDILIGSPYAKGERALIAAIINQSISDGCSVRRPRHPSLRNTKKDKLNIRKQKLLLLSCSLIFKKFINKKIKFPYYIFSIITRLEMLQIHGEEIAWAGREFFNPDNEIFCFYCNLLDIEPVYLCKKVTDYFRKIDNGLYKKIELIA
jgi:hypothetical protein